MLVFFPAELLINYASLSWILNVILASEMCLHFNSLLHCTIYCKIQKCSFGWILILLFYRDNYPLKYFSKAFQSPLIDAASVTTAWWRWNSLFLIPPHCRLDASSGPMPVEFAKPINDSVTVHPQSGYMQIRWIPLKRHRWLQTAVLPKVSSFLFSIHMLFSISPKSLQPWLEQLLKTDWRKNRSEMYSPRHKIKKNTTHIFLN